MTPTTKDGEHIRREAVDSIIFHATPRTLLEGRGPWLLERGTGALLYDIDGNEYLDALSGGVFAVLAGYGREEIARAMYDQAVRLNYTSPYGTASGPTVDLATRLSALAPGGEWSSFFCNSGSEAVEAAFKLARQYHEANGDGKRYKVVSLRRAYHGATAGALSATGWSPGFGAFKRAADPVVPTAGHASAMPPYCHRCELGLEYPACGTLCATTVEQAILGGDPELASCVIVEPVMGTAGCIVPPDGYLERVREICDRYGVLMVADEVVCGFGRTGTWFGVNHAGVTPDILVVAKGLTSGYAPMAAAMARREVAERIPIFWDVHTYGGHPVSAAVALANLEIIEREGLVENAVTVGAHMLRLLDTLRRRPIVGDVRGSGLFMAVELRDPGLDDVVASTALSNGLFVRPLGGTILIAPPLVFTVAQAEQAVEILTTALDEAERMRRGPGNPLDE